MSGCDAVIHLAGSYRVGIPASERPAMYEANVALTERVLDAAISLGIPRIVTASTVNVFGNTRGRIVDEKYRRDPADGFLSYYDETKYRAHVAAKARISAGAPIVIVMPGATYGAGDHSAIGGQFEAVYHGRARYTALGEFGLSPTYVDDLASGVVARDRPGSSGRELRAGRREHAPSRRDQDRRQGGRPSPATPQPPDQPASPVCPDRTRLADG